MENGAPIPLIGEGPCLPAPRNAFARCRSFSRGRKYIFRIDKPVRTYYNKYKV